MTAPDPVRRRRASTLASVFFAPMGQATVRDLQRELRPSTTSPPAATPCAPT